MLSFRGDEVDEKSLRFLPSPEGEVEMTERAAIEKLIVVVGLKGFG